MIRVVQRGFFFRAVFFSKEKRCEAAVVTGGSWCWAFFFFEQKIGVLWAFFWSRKICSDNFFFWQKREPDNFWVYLFYRKVFLDQIQRTVFG